MNWVMEGQWPRLRKFLVAAMGLPLILTFTSIDSPVARAVNTQADACASTVVGSATAINSVPGYCILTFTNTSSGATWTVPAGVSYVQYLIVAGGGAGGRGDAGGWEAGGGGAGGVLTGYTNLTPGTAQTIYVGTGGTSTSTTPTTAGNSTAFGLTAIGGGAGGYATGSGANGGSGGGGTHSMTNAGSGTAGQGNAGEKAALSSAGGGGGGAGGAPVAGNGGIGIASSITGTDTYYGDGGAAGHSRVTYTDWQGVATTYDEYSRRGGSGGGGTGPSANGQNGGNASGYGGGGAGAYGNASYIGGSGYQGIVVVRWAMVPVVNGLTAYFRNDTAATTDFVPNAITTDANYCYSGIYNTRLNLNWSTGHPNSSDGMNIYGNQPSTTCTDDNYSGYLYGYILAPYTGTVTFNENTDDGIKMMIDNQVVLNRIGNAGSSSATFQMVAGQILPIQIWFHEGGGTAQLVIGWAYGAQASTVIPAASLGTTPGAFTSTPMVNGNCQIGSSASCPALSPQEINNLYGTTANGVYWLNINGTAQQVYVLLDPAVDGGGYVMLMKGANNSSTFQYSATHWTTNSILNDSSGYLRRNDSNNEDAKFNAFNYLPATKLLAIFPTFNTTSYSGYPTGALATSSYGFTWNEAMPTDAYNPLAIWSNSTLQRTEILDDNITIATGIYRQKLRAATDTDAGRVGTSSNSFFSTQKYVKFYGFNYRQREWNYPTNGTQARWGFGFNENNPGDETNNDVEGGIGISYGSTNWNAGDIWGCCETLLGRKAQTTFEIYGKMAAPSLPAPTNLTAVAHTGGTVTVSWSKATNSAPTEYVIQSRVANTTWTDASVLTQRVLMPSDTSSVSVNLSGFTTTNKYDFRVFARSINGTTWVNSSAATSLSTTTNTPVAPTFTLQPVDTTTTAAMTAQFRVTATRTDTGTLTYQWQKSTTSGGSTFVNTSYGVDTGTSLTTSALTTADSGYKFRVIVTNTIAGETNTATSNVVTLTVNPAMTLDLSSIAATIGRARSDTATVSGGTGAKSVSFNLSPTNSGITTDISTIATDGKIKINTSASALLGSYTETLTVTDTAGATTVQAISIVVNSVPTFGGGGITTKGLVLNLDAGNSQSYSGTGATTWNDLSKVTGNATMGASSPKTCNAPTYSSSNYGTLAFSPASLQCVELATTASYNNFTAEVWTKFNSLPNTQASLITTWYSTGGDKINYAIMFNGAGQIMGGLYDGGTWYSTDPTSGATSVTTNTWYHFVLSYDTTSGALKLYENGTVVSSKTYSGLLPQQNRNWIFIGHRWDSEEYIDGQIPVVRLYNRALLSTEVTANYNALASRYTSAGASARSVQSTTGVAYAPFTYTAADGTAPRSITLTGTAAGVTIDTSTTNQAQLKVPATLAAGSYQETLTITDTNSSITLLPINLTVNQPISLTATTQNLSTTYGFATVDTVVATLGSGTKTFSIESSATVAGLTFDTNTANQLLIKLSNSVPVGTYLETITATDSATATAFYLVTVVVNPVPTIAGAGNITATAKDSQSFTGITATYGTGKKSFTLTSTPQNVGPNVAVVSTAGITLDTSVANAATINYNGNTPAGLYLETLTVVDSVGATVATSFYLTIASPPSFTNYNSGIVTQGILLNLDAANGQSATGSNTTWYDISGNGKNATAGAVPTALASVNSNVASCSAPTYSNTNNLGYYYFNGSQCLYVPNLGGQLDKNYTVEAWVKYLSYSANNVLICGAYYNSINYYLGDFSTGTSIYGGYWDGAGWRYPSTGIPITVGTWYHLAMTYNGSTMITYVDSATSSATSSVGWTGGMGTASPYGLYIGTYTAGGYVNAQVSAVRIYNRALSSTELAQNYNAQAARFTAANLNGNAIATTQGVNYSSPVFTSIEGTATKSVAVATTPTNSGITFTSSPTNTAMINVASTVLAGSYNETITTTDSVGSATPFQVYLTVNQPIALATTSSTIQTTIGKAISDTVTATLGTGTKTFTLQSSVANAGITLDTSTANQAVLKFNSSVPAATYIETITATDTVGATAISVITVIVNPAALISGLSSIQSTAGTAFTSAAYSATLGTGNKTFTYSVSPSNAGITIDTSTANSALIKTTAAVTAATYTVTLTTTDSVTAQSSSAITLIVNPAISFTGTQAQIRKYGATKVDTFTAVNGTGNKSFSFAPNNRSYITWDTSTVNTARLTIGAGLIPGTYYETITATDTVSATAQYLVTITSSLADTLTVSVDTITSVTYNASQVNVSPTITVSGLVFTDTGTAATFNYTGVNGTTYAYSTSKPTNAGSYSVSPSALTLTSGSPTYYTAINYVANTLTVNKANQSTVSVMTTNGVLGSPLTVYNTGGSGTGAYTDTITAGSTASGCSLIGYILTSSSVGYCNVLAVRAGDSNYLSETSTSTSIFFFQYLIYLPQAQTTTGPTINLPGQTGIGVETSTATLSIISFTPTTGGAGTSVVITGTGFINVTDVRFGRSNPATSFVVNSPTQITAIVPSGVSGVRIIVYTDNDVAISPGSYGP